MTAGEELDWVPATVDDAASVKSALQQLPPRKKMLLKVAEAVRARWEAGKPIAGEELRKCTDSQSAEALRKSIAAINSLVCRWSIKLGKEESSGLYTVMTMVGAPKRGAAPTVDGAPPAKTKPVQVRWRFRLKDGSFLPKEWLAVDMEFQPPLRSVSENEVEIVVKRANKAWIHPKGFSDFESFRKQKWEEHKEKYPTAAKRYCCHVREVHGDETEEGQPVVTLTTACIEFEDYVATTWCSAAAITLDTGAPSTIQEWLNTSVHTLHPRRFPFSSNLLSVDVNLLTIDDHLILRDDGHGKLECAVAGPMDWLLDVMRNSTGVPDPRETVFRKSCEQLGFPLRPGRVVWLGVGIGLEKGNVSLFGVVRTNLTLEAVKPLQDKLAYKSFSKLLESIHLRRRGAEVDETFKEVCARLVLESPDKNKRARNHLQILMALTLRSFYGAEHVLLEVVHPA